jgi:predicted pyridoxine 5'-phosphate oxidase superfamily flavin-nucleotide-binding protein
MQSYLDLAFTPAVLALQEERGARGVHGPVSDGPIQLDPAEIDHITERDSFYMATVSEDGWPYVQHRGGDVGFVKVLGPTTLGWVERFGNRQYLGTGNITANGRIALIFVDYPGRTRLKLSGEATYHGQPSTELLADLDGLDIRNDGVITVEVTATAWNCPKLLTPRYSAEQVASVVGPLQARIDELEARLRIDT